MRKVRIGDVGEVITGKTPKTSVSEYYNGNFPFLTPVDFSSLKIIKDTKKTISQTGLESIKKCFIPKNSICVTCIGSDMGKVAVNMMDCATNQQIKLHFISYRFTVYLLCHKKCFTFNQKNGRSLNCRPYSQ